MWWVRPNPGGVLLLIRNNLGVRRWQGSGGRKNFWRGAGERVGRLAARTRVLARGRTGGRSGGGRGRREGRRRGVRCTRGWRGHVRVGRLSRGRGGCGDRGPAGRGPWQAHGGAGCGGAWGANAEPRQRAVAPMGEQTPETRRQAADLVPVQSREPGVRSLARGNGGDDGLKAGENRAEEGGEDGH